jgi:hypothetical protein
MTLIRVGKTVITRLNSDAQSIACIGFHMIVRIPTTSCAIGTETSIDTNGLDDDDERSNCSKKKKKRALSHDVCVIVVVGIDCYL